MRVFVEGIGLAAEGLDGWSVSRAVLGGSEPYRRGPLHLTPSPLLAVTERRRVVQTVKLALQVGAEAFAMAQRDPAETAAVFASSGGDGETIHSILEAVNTASIDVSPTRFHNSVHNAPSGYWSIAYKTRMPTTSLCAYDAGFAAGLLEAAVQATVSGRAVGLIAYDLPYPEPLNAARPLGAGFGTALVLAPSQTAASLAALDIAFGRASGAETTLNDPDFETLRRQNPTARSLPLLRAFARGDNPEIVLDGGLGNSLRLRVTPVQR
jgi:hypothetical protein